MLYIDNELKLNDAISHIKSQSEIGIDTEFVRKDTYFANLCLLQISTKEEIFVIDPLKLKLESFVEILIDEKIKKIFHDPHQDLGIFYKNFGVITNNIFDVQASVKFLGIRNQISYQDACLRILNVKIEKTQQFRQWNLRPLSPEMIDYAAQDVVYLINLYEKLRQMMEEKLMYKNFCYYMNELFCKKEFYHPNLDEVWKKMKINEANPKIIDNLTILAAFREECAIVLNMPRGHTISDQDLLLIATKLPANEREMNSLNIKSSFNRSQKARLFEICLGIKDRIM